MLKYGNIKPISKKGLLLLSFRNRLLTSIRELQLICDAEDEDINYYDDMNNALGNLIHKLREVDLELGKLVSKSYR